ncbi:hypothetical protein GF373_09050 [bacterium]|nr:hypothetical protein [bacterium]
MMRVKNMAEHIFDPRSHCIISFDGMNGEKKDCKHNGVDIKRFPAFSGEELQWGRHNIVLN